MKIYHVCDGQWDGGDLLSLSQRRSWSDETAEIIAERWPDVEPGEYYQFEGNHIHCHSTLAEALAYLFEECDFGEILEIDTGHQDADFTVENGREYPHPTVSRRIDSACVRKIADTETALDKLSPSELEQFAKDLGYDGATGQMKRTGGGVGQRDLDDETRTKP